MCCSFRVAIPHHIRSDKHSVGKLTAHKLLLSQGHPSSLVTQIGHTPPSPGRTEPRWVFPEQTAASILVLAGMRPAANNACVLQHAKSIPTTAERLLRMNNNRHQRHSLSSDEASRTKQPTRQVVV